MYGLDECILVELKKHLAVICVCLVITISLIPSFHASVILLFFFPPFFFSVR